jgi:sigma-E factor negative regulatory protein RseA
MKSRISELLDGELEFDEAAGALDALRAEGEARDTWRRYHLIGDAMRDTRMLSAGFAARVAARIAGEPTVMAPGRIAPARARQRWQFLSAAASLAAVALVGWVAFGPQEDTALTAQAPSTLALAPAPAQALQTVVAQVPPPSSANDYLYAHQGLSPRNSLQGVAPCVRMVSSDEISVQKR